MCRVRSTECVHSYKHRAHFALQRELHKHNFAEVMEKFHPPTDSAAVERAAAEPEQAIYDALLRSDTKMEVRCGVNVFECVCVCVCACVRATETQWRADARRTSRTILCRDS